MVGVDVDQVGDDVDRMNAYYDVKLKSPVLIGERHRSAGEVVRVPARVARDLCRDGAGEPHSLVASVRRWLTAGLGGAAVEDAPVNPALPLQPNIRLISGSLFVGSKSYTKQDGPFYYQGDLLRLLALSDPIRDSPTERHAVAAGRHIPKIKLLVPLTDEENTRLQAMRYDLYSQAMQPFAMSKYGCQVGTRPEGDPIAG